MEDLYQVGDNLVHTGNRLGNNVFKAQKINRIKTVNLGKILVYHLSHKCLIWQTETESRGRQH